jgi:hypothetical protein
VLVEAVRSENGLHYKDFPITVNKKLKNFWLSLGEPLQSRIPRRFSGLKFFSSTSFTAELLRGKNALRKICLLPRKK